MLRGAKPTPTPLKLLRGNPGQRALPKGNPQPTKPETCPGPPQKIRRKADAVEEWNRIAPELWRMNILTVADIPALALYCLAYARWCEAEDALYAMAEDDPHHNGLLITGATGSKVANPLVNMARCAGHDLMRYAIEFGFTPSSRSRITGAAAGDGAESKFDGLLANQA